MKLYLECNMGAAGDMLMAALSELLPDRDSFLHRMNGLGIPGVHIGCVPAQKCGITGSHIHVSINDETEVSQDVSFAADPETGNNEPHTSEYRHGHHHSHGHSHTDSVSATGHHHHFSFSDICGLISSLDLPEKVKADAVAVYRIIGEAESDVHGVPVSKSIFTRWARWTPSPT